MNSLPTGPFLARDLPALGIDRAELTRALDAGVVRQVFRGVYVPGASDDDLRVRMEAVRLALDDRQIACDRTAAWLHGIDLYRFGEFEGVPRPETCVPRWHSRTTLRGIRGMTRSLLPTDIEVREGLRMTTPLRTALDLGCVLFRKDALAALDQYRRLYGVAEKDLAFGVERFRGRRGVRQLRTLLPLSDPLAESVRESWTRLAILDAGLPRPVLQYWWNDTYRLDMAYPAKRIGIEYDGQDFHLRTPAQVEHDRRRREHLADDGWVLVVVRNGDFHGAKLEKWTARVADLFELRTRGNRRW